ncbi:hypothetical protein LCGC14_1992050 [marine sediment metagenome]|uniref:Uncharacterized protein n=1 Tax=marine sediment metagenome TaxID=412755 RepID=A0A0F9I2X7_9ZZZZ
MVGIKRRRIIKPSIIRRRRPIRRTKVTGKTTGEIGKIARDKNRKAITKIKRRIRRR